MSKKENKAEQTAPEQQEPVEQQAEVQTEPQAEQTQPQGEAQSESADPLLTELESLKDQVAQQEDKYLRLAAEYDNYRRRSQKE